MPCLADRFSTKQGISDKVAGAAWALDGQGLLLNGVDCVRANLCSAKIVLTDNDKFVILLHLIV